MFEYFFIIGTMFLIISGALDEFRLNKALSCSVLAILFVLSMLPDMKIKYTVYFSWAGVFVLVIAIFMFLVMTKEHLSTLLYGSALGLLMWALAMLIPGFNQWYLKAAVFSFIGATLGSTYFQGGVVSVLGCLVCDLFTWLIAVDLELITVSLFTGDNKLIVILSLLGPMMLMSLAGKKKKAITLEGIHGAS